MRFIESTCGQPKRSGAAGTFTTSTGVSSNFHKAIRRLAESMKRAERIGIHKRCQTTGWAIEAIGVERIFPDRVTTIQSGALLPL